MPLTLCMMPMLCCAAGIAAGFAATVLGSPWDVVGTRLMAQGQGSGKDPPKVRWRPLLRTSCLDQLQARELLYPACAGKVQ